MFNYATIKHLLLLYSDTFEDRSSSAFSFRLYHLYSRLSNMNIGSWPVEAEGLSDAQVQYREVTSKENSQLLWTKAFLQTGSYDENRYRQIAANTCERILREESHLSPPRSTPRRLSSTIAISVSETSTRQHSVKDHSFPQALPLPIPSNKTKPSYTRFSCYLRSHNMKSPSKPSKRKLPTTISTILPQNNNQTYEKTKSVSPQKKVIHLNDECREQMCRKCLLLIEKSSSQVSSTLLCRSCLQCVRNSNQRMTVQKIGLTKCEENELKQIIEVVIEQFQDHFGQALNLSIKQMNQHLLSNIHLFYRHYQQEFEQLTKKYRFAFLERFIELMKKFPNKAQTNNTTQKPKLPTSRQRSITHPPNILSMSSLSGSLITEKDPSETVAHLSTPSNSLSTSTTSNRSMIIDKKKTFNSHRKHLPIQSTSSKKTFILNPTRQRQSSSRSKKEGSPTLQLIDAYRFRDTLRTNHTHFSSPRVKLR